MPTRIQPPPSLLSLARAQDWVLTRSQCLAHQLSDEVRERLVHTGMWQSVACGLVVAHNGPISWHTRVHAAVLGCSPMAMICDHSAALLWGLLRGPEPPVTVLIPHDARVQDHPWWRIRRTRHWPASSCGTPARTPLSETIIDMCQIDPDNAYRYLVDGLHHHRTTTETLLEALDVRPRVKNRRFLEAVLQRVGQGICSELEHRYAIDVEKAHGLPVGSRQERIGSAITDVRYGTVLIELDGRTGHVGMGRFRDMDRDNRHALTGFTTLRFGWDDVTRRPCAVAAQVARMLRRQGWGGQLRSCPRCR